MAAMRATAMASPFERVWEVRVVWAVGVEKRRVAVAVARRVVGVLWEMSTMWAAPVASRWVSLLGGLVASVLVVAMVDAVDALLDSFADLEDCWESLGLEIVFCTGEVLYARMP